MNNAIATAAAESIEISGQPRAEIFCDGVGWIAFYAGVVRIDLMALDAPTSAQRSGHVTQRLILPIDGFIRMFAAMHDLAQKLEAAGLIARKQGRPAAAVSEPTFELGAERGKPASSNVE